MDPLRYFFVILFDKVIFKTANNVLIKKYDNTNWEFLEYNIKKYILLYFFT